jgi:hypothetical protein
MQQNPTTQYIPTEYHRQKGVSRGKMPLRMDRQRHADHCSGNNVSIPLAHTLTTTGQAVDLPLNFNLRVAA